MHIDNFSDMSFNKDVVISRTNNQRSGFTLIELLIVIAVIGILAGGILTLLNPFEQFAKAQDSERKNTLRELANALERYYIEKGQYPIAVNWFSSEPGDNAPNGLGNNGDWIPGLLASKEITRLPRDPKGDPSSNPNCGSVWKRAYLYSADASGSCYKLLSHCAPEAADAFSPTDPFFDPARPTWAWMVCSSPGSVCCSY